MMESITPQERIKINQLVYRLGMKEIPSDTNVMAWVLPTLEAVVKKFEKLEDCIKEQAKRMVEIEIALKEKEKERGRV